ncbi:hypothetical protein ACYX7E_02540 [Luteimonas sp. RIT-PG2_3]|jgi:hypothetical protein
MNQPDANGMPTLKPNWSAFAKLGAITAAVGGVSLHLMGQAAHRVHLYQMGVSAGHFPKTTDWFVINGYYTLAELFLVFVKAFSEHKWQIALWILALSLYMYGMEKLGAWLRAKDPATRLAGLPAWASELLRNLFASTFVLVGIPIAIMFVMMILLLPAVVGETIGKDVAAKELARFASGCDRDELDAAMRCSQIVMDGELLFTGYIIDASETHVAIFDPATRRSTVVETAGKAIMGRQASTPTD